MAHPGLCLLVLSASPASTHTRHFLPCFTTHRAKGLAMPPPWSPCCFIPLSFPCYFFCLLCRRVGPLRELLLILQNLAQKSPPQEAFPALFAELVTHSLPLSGEHWSQELLIICHPLLPHSESKGLAHGSPPIRSLGSAVLQSSTWVPVTGGTTLAFCSFHSVSCLQ